jgi:transcriptional regulator GlxA family with amidase domain
MPSKIKQPKNKRDPWKVAALIYDGLSMFEFSIVGEVFGLSRPELSPWYQFSIAALETGRLKSNSGITVNADGGLGILDHAGTDRIDLQRRLSPRGNRPSGWTSGNHPLALCRGAGPEVS